MVRSVYALILRLHPRPFRQRFAKEMLWIFDQTMGARARSALVADALLSLARQWTLRSEFWEHPNEGALAAPAPDGVPAFYTCGNSTPRLGSLLNGFVLTVASFGALAYVIEHGQPAGFVTLPRVVTPSPNRMPIAARDRPAAATEGSWALDRGPTVHRPPISPENVQPIAARDRTLQVRVPDSTGRAAGDASTGSPLLKTTPVFKTPPAFKTTGGGHSPASQVASVPTASQAARLIALLDKNGDGAISKDERSSDEAERFRELLARADLNHDGTVTLEELRAVGSIGLDGVLPRTGRE